MIKKDYRLEETDLKIIETIKDELGLKSDSETVRYLIRQYGKEKKSENNIQLAILRKIEEGVDLLVDIANTELIEKNADKLYPTKIAESPVISNARKLRREELAHRKQKADYKKNKHAREQGKDM